MKRTSQPAQSRSVSEGIPTACLRFAACVALLFCGAANALAEIQTFDTPASVTAAGWTGNGNTAAPNNYGFSATSNAGGAAGEGGGAIAVRTTDFTYFADLTLPAGLSQQTPLFASGKFTVTDFAFDGGFELGFFNSTSTTKATGGGVGGIDEAIMLRVLDGGRMVVRAGNQGSASSPGGTFAANEDYRYTFFYDPNGGGIGNGSIFAQFYRQSDNMLVDTRTLNFPSGGAPYSLNAFGIASLDFDRNDPATGFFVDDLEYFSGEPPRPPVLLGVERQQFDSDAEAAAAGWAGARNRDGAFNSDFGFSPTGNAAAAAGEAGGAVPGRTSLVAYYADTTLGGALSQKLPLVASGRFTITSIEGLDGGFEIGFFDPAMTDGTPNFIGMRLVDGTPTSLRWWPHRDVNGSSESPDGANQLAVGEDYAFTLNYDPNGAGTGVGRASVEFVRLADGVSLGVRTLDFSSLGPEATLSAFGIKTLDFNANIGGNARLFLDSLEYTTVVPEPSAFALAGISLAALLLVQRRRPNA